MKIKTLVFVIFCILFVRNAFALLGDNEVIQNTLEDRMEIGDHIAYAIVDYNNGKVLSSYNETKKMYPASLTKMMTLFIIFDRIKNNEISFDNVITVSQKAASQVPTKLGLPAGSKITVRDAILATIVKSHNDMAFALAEKVAGSEAEFIKLMNNKVKELGLKNTNFASVTGLHNKNQYTTVLDMVILARALMITHNSFYSLFSVSGFKWQKTNYISTNHLLTDDRVDGIKTGYTNASGFNLVTSAQQNNVRIVTAVMGFRSAKNRDEYMKQIIEDGFIYAQSEREENLRFITKPQELTNKNNNLKVKHDNYQLDKLTEDSNYNITEYSEDNNIDNISNADNDGENNIANYNLAFDNKYVIDKISYLDFVDDRNKIFIKPKVNIAKVENRGSYKIQIGAFSNYNSALREAYNISKIRAVSKILPKNKVAVDKNNSYYLSRFTKLTKANAYNSCKVLQDKGYDCFVISG